MKIFSSLMGRGVLLLSSLLLILPSAQAVEPVRQFQVDVIPITTSLGTPVVTQSESQALIDRVNAGMNDATGGVIRFTLRNLLPTIAPGVPVTTSTDVGKVSGITPKADSGFESAILIGVIVKDQSLPFAGMAGGQYMLVNYAWDRMSSWILSHEFGHNLGVLHANSATCTTVLPIICEQLEYGDYSSVMGDYVYSYVAQPYIARFSATELDKLKVLPADKRSIAAESGEYKLAPVYSTNIDLPKVLYIPIGNEYAYSVEYRPAIGNDSTLAQTQIYTSSGSYYTNTQSNGLQLRIIQTAGTDYTSILPKTSNKERFGTALVSDSLTGPQIQPMGKTFLLSDGSTVTFVSADPIIGAVVKVVRSPDTEAPKINSLSARWAYGTYFLGPNKERLVKKNSAKEWEFPVIEVPAKGVSDNRMLKSLELELNGKVVDQISGAAVTPTTIFKYQTTDVGKFEVRLIATDYSGNSVATTPTSFESMYFKLVLPGVATNLGKDPRTSIVFSFYKVDSDVTYDLTNLSSGTIASTIEINGITYITVERVERNSKLTAQLTGTDSVGHTDGSQTITGVVSKSVCSNKECFVGATWKVSTGNWSPGVGIMSLQEKIKGKWELVQSAKPELLNLANKKLPNTYVLMVNQTVVGPHTYRLVIAPSKSFKGYTGPAFTQVVLP